MKRLSVLRSIAFPSLILGYACLCRLYFFSGFALCDDAQELATVIHVLGRGPALFDHLHVRFGVWVFNWLTFSLFGVSEFSFFLPTVLMSASLGVVGYWILLAWRYRPRHAFLAGLMIASAPFEVLIGTLRANDLILSWLLAVGLALFIVLKERPVLQGVSTAFFLWFGFYVKLWVVYFLPVLGIYYLIALWRHRAWRGPIGFVVASLVLHGATCLVWKVSTGQFLPFIWVHAATYPVAREALPRLFERYPQLLFQGSEFGTTLFGSIPYLLIAGLGLKLIATTLRSRYDVGFGLDARDFWLSGYYGSFFLLLNFFPNSFVFDQYYSAPRIFRYLTPLSFPMTLHLAKLALDLSRVKLGRAAAEAGALIVVVALIGLNLFETAEAVRPGLMNRSNLRAVVTDLRAHHPPRLVTEAWLSFFMRHLYLKDVSQTEIIPVLRTHRASQYERWLERRQAGFPKGTMLLTGIGSCVHYGAHYDGFRLAQFQDDLHPAWKPVKEYGVLSYLPVPEAVKLWEWSGEMTDTPPAPADALSRSQNPNALFKAGMARFEQGDCPEAQPKFRKVFEDFPKSQRAADASYFHTICVFRNARWAETIVWFRKLIETYPRSPWVAGAHYHIGLSQAALGNTEQARTSFEYVRDHFTDHPALAKLAEEQLEKLR
jgi:tetratricopeptide (TPR) repeat protein